MKKPVFRDPQDWMKEGTECFYHSIIGEMHDGVKRKVVDEPWQLGHGQWVIKIEGIRGGVALEAITLAK